MGVSCLNPLSQILIRLNLLLLKILLGEPCLDLESCLKIHIPVLGSAIIDKELHFVNMNGLPFLYHSSKTTLEIHVQIILSNIILILIKILVENHDFD